MLKLKYLPHSILFTASFLLLLACSTESKDKLLFERTIDVEANTVPLTEILSPDFLTIAGGYLYLSSSKTKEMLYAYRLPELSFAWSGGRKGQGSGEFQNFPMFCESDADALYVWGQNVLSIARYDVETDGSLRQTGTLRLPTYESFNQMHLIGDSLFVYNAFPDAMNIQYIDLTNGEKLEAIPTGKPVKDTFLNPDRGWMATNGTTLLYAYLYKNQVDVYDFATRRLRTRLVGDYPHITPSRGADNREFYIGVYAGKHFFYALRRGEHNAESWLDIFTGDGTPYLRCRLARPIHLFTVDEAHNLLIGYNYEKEELLLTFELPL